MSSKEGTMQECVARKRCVGIFIGVLQSRVAIQTAKPARAKDIL